MVKSRRVTDSDGDSGKAELVDVSVFGHQFRLLGGLAEALITLEKEGAVYSHFWDEASQTFKYYRIRFLPREIFEYVEAHIAQQEFDDAIADGADFEAALRAIRDPLIRERVYSYGNFGKLRMRDGVVEDIRGCAASFYPPEIEALVCGQRPDRYELLPNLGAVDEISLLIRLIDNFRVGARLLANRGHSRSPFVLENEYDVQDLLFISIRGVFNDARLEEWTPKHAGTSKRVDIVVPSLGALVETKYVRSKSHARSVANEIKIDIESYHSYPACRSVLVLGMIRTPRFLIRRQSRQISQGGGSRATLLSMST